MKKKSLLALSLAMWAFVACTSDEDINSSSRDDNNKETALVSLKLDIAKPFTKGNPNANDKLEGSVAENQLNNLKVVLAYPAGIKREIDVTDLSSTTDGITWDSDQKKLSFSAPVGKATIYVYANVVEADKTDLAGDGFATAVSKGDASDYYVEETNPNFFMSGVSSKAIDIKESGENTETVEIERAAVKVSAECNNPTLKNIEPESTTKAVVSGTATEPVGILVGMGFQLKNTAKSCWLLANNDATVSNIDYDNVDESTEVEEIDMTKSGSVTDSKPDASSYQGLAHLYCLENIPSVSQVSDGETRYTFVNFKAVFAPRKVLAFEENTSSEDDAKGYVVASDLKDRKDDLENITEGKTFYVVRNTGLYQHSYILHSDLCDENSTGIKTEFGFTKGEGKMWTVSGIEGITEVEEYTNGECWFNTNYLLSGADANSKTDKNIYRNDWYNLKVNSITFPGSSTPGEAAPTNSIALTIEVLSWNFFEQNLDLGEEQVTPDTPEE